MVYQNKNFLGISKLICAPIKKIQLAEVLRSSGLGGILADDMGLGKTHKQ